MPNWIKTRIDLGNRPLIELDLARLFFRASQSDPDRFLAWLIDGAIETVETDSRYVVHPANYAAELSANTRAVQLPFGPYHAGSAALVRLDEDDNETAVDGTIVHDGGSPGCLELPEVSEDHAKLKLTYQAGSSDLRRDVELVVLSLAAHRYEHREAATAGDVVKTVPIGYHHVIRGLDPMLDGVS